MKVEQRRLVDRERSVSPVEMMNDDFGSGQRAFMDSVRSRGGRVVVVTHPRTANNHKELTVVRGEYLEVCFFPSLLLSFIQPSFIPFLLISLSTFVITTHPNELP